MGGEIGRPKVSVIIPSYNHERYIRDCLESVRAQTYKHLEIIVVDDGSTDGTVEILKGYVGQITLTQQTNAGTQAARNRAIEAASGDFIALLDSDDVWLPNKLERQLAVFSGSPETGLVYSLAHKIDSSGDLLDGGATLGVPIADPTRAFSQLLFGNVIPALTAMFRRSCIDEVGMFDENLLGSGDWDLWLRIAARWDIACVPDSLALYRVHEGNTAIRLCRNKAIRAEYDRVLQKAFALKSREVIDNAMREMASARNHLRNAESEAMIGDATACGRELALALTLDPGLARETDFLVGRIAYWAHEYCSTEKTGAKYRQFVRELFSELAAVSPSITYLRREILSTTTMSAVFCMASSGNSAALRSLLHVGITARPQWLLNLGVWSLMADIFLGRKATGKIRNIIRRLRATRT